MKNKIMYRCSILIATFFVGMSFMSCNDDALQEGVIGNGVAVSVSEISAYPTGDIIAFLVTSDRDWHIDNIPYWITVVPSSGRAGSTKVNISAAFNDEKADRGTVLFVDAEDGSYSISIPVNQEYPYFRLNRLEGYDFLWSDNASMTNRMVHIDVECNTEWTLRAVQSQKGSYDIRLSDHIISSDNEVQTVTASGDGTITVIPLVQNLGDVERSLDIELKAPEASVLLEFIQDYLTFMLNNNYISCNELGISQNGFNIVSESPWRLKTPQEVWFAFEDSDVSGEGAPGNAVCTDLGQLNIFPNATRDRQVRDIIFKCEAGPEIALNVEQSPFIFDSDVNSIAFANKDDASRSFNFDSSTDWAMEVDRDAASWVEVSPLSGKGEVGGLSETVSVSVKNQNLSMDDRRASLKIYNRINSLTDIVEISQEAFKFETDVTAIDIKTLDVSEQSFMLTSSGPWQLTYTGDWLQVMETDGGEGVCEVRLKARSGNYEEKPRTASVNINSILNGEKLRIDVLQKGYVFNVSAEKDLSDLPPVNVPVNYINVESPNNWSVQSAVPWCTLSQTSGVNDTRLTLNVHDNYSQSRSGNILFYNPDMDKTVTVHLSQNAFVFDIDSPSIESLPPVNASSFSFKINCSADWQIKSEDWLAPSVLSGTGSKTVTVTVADNVHKTSRSGVIEILSTKSGETKSFTIKQLPFEFDETSVDLDAFEPVGNKPQLIKIVSSGRWYVENNSSWVNIAHSEGFGNAELSVNVYDNISASERTHTFYVISRDNPDYKKKITVKQNKYKFDTSPVVKTIASSGGNVNVSIVCSGKWSIKAMSGHNLPDWLTFNKKNGTGDSSVRITVSKNTTGVPRTAEIYIISDDNPGLKKKVTLRQQAGQ